jgi:LPS O-antigen subunit length determinant protein (WzzB/FepE family)
MAPSHSNEESHQVSLPALADTIERTIMVLRRNYADAVRLTAREELLAELADDGTTARLHADTARYHHGSADAYARALTHLLREGGPDVFVDRHEARLTTTEADLAPMRCQDRPYRPFDPDKI